MILTTPHSHRKRPHSRLEWSELYNDMDPNACVYEPPGQSFIGAVLGKQWLGHFKRRAADGGALQERCERRQKKLDSPEFWLISTILATLPNFLHLSLGIAPAWNIWTTHYCERDYGDNRVGNQISTLASKFELGEETVLFCSI